MPPFRSHRRARSRASTPALQPAPAVSQPPTPSPHTHEGTSGGRVSVGTLDDIQAVALDLTQTITNVMSNIADTFPIPGLKIGLLALTEVIKKLQTMQTNVEGVAMLQQRIASLVASVNELLEGSRRRWLPQTMIARIEELAELWKGIAQRAAKINAQGRLRRFILSNRDAKKLGDLIGEINESIQEKIVTQGILNIENYVYEIHEDVKAIMAFLNVSMPKHAKMAPYNSNDVRRSCLEGTRVDFLREVYTWIIAGCKTDKATPEGGIVLWINGLAGTGKTTVAHTVSAWCDSPDRRILGGSFFCSRSDNDCSDPTLIFPTLCRQLCVHHRPFGAEVEAILKQNPDIADYGLYRQFEELIVLPLEALKSPFPRTVFVLDALDELKSTGQNTTKSTVLRVIAKFAHRIARFLLFVITSRPEADITALFDAKRGESLKDTTTPLLIHDVPIDVALKDIRLYIDHEFETNVAFQLIEPGWPSTEERDTLAERSQGLYIFVATAIKFILDVAYLDPKGQMGLLATSMAGSSTPHKFLSTLYTTILVASYERVSPELASRLRDVLGTVVLAHEALSSLSIAKLVGLDAATVRSTLTGLHSVLHIPADDSEPIRIIHPTFPEFLLQSPDVSSIDLPDTATVPAHLRLQPAGCHWYLFSRCIEAMSGTLKRDIIGIRYPAMFLSEVDNLEESVDKTFKPHVSYSCRFWGHHLRKGVGSARTLDVSQRFRNFVQKELLYWIEACSLLDAIDMVIFALETVLVACQTLEGQFADLAPLLMDCRRLVIAYSPWIHAAPLQLYHFVLGIAPTASRVRTTYSHECGCALAVEHGTLASWTRCLATIPLSTTGVAISPDGSRFIPAAGRGKPTIWKTATRTCLQSSDGGHEGWVKCVTFSPDGRYFASCSEKRVYAWGTSSKELVHTKVYVWETSSEELVHTLECYSSRCTVRRRGQHSHHMEYSGDGRHIVTTTDGGANLWDAANGRCLRTFDDASFFGCQVGISYDGIVIAHGGQNACLYNVSTSTTEELEFPRYVNGCTFSPDGRWVAARSDDVIRIWAWPGKTVVRTIDASNELCGRLVFSHDGTTIGCGSHKGVVYLWQVASQEPPCILQGHTRAVHDLAYSPDKSYIISAGDDGIRVWDTILSSYLTSELVIPPPSPSIPLPPPPANSAPLFALVRSGKHAIALLHLPTLGIQPEQLALGAQMPDGVPTATLFSDVFEAYNTARQVFQRNYGYGHPYPWASLMGWQHTSLAAPYPFAISPDGSLMAYRSPADDKVVDVCDLRKGTVVAVRTDQTYHIYSIAISPDNSRLVIGSGDSFVKVWDIVTGALVCSHHGKYPSSWMPTVAFSSDGCLVAFGRHQTVGVLEVSTERVIRTWNSHQYDPISNVIFSADNVHLVAHHDTGSFYIWDITTGASICTFSLHDHHHLRSPIFSPDDTGLLVNGDDGSTRTVSLWEPGTRTWPAYHITPDGWVYAMSPGRTRRLCLLPPEWRHPLYSHGAMLYVGDAKSDPGTDEMIVLDTSHLLKYVDSLDP